MKPFKKSFIDSESVLFNNNVRIDAMLKDRPAGLKFISSVQNVENLDMRFFFQKKHTSRTNKALSLKCNLQMDPRPPIRLTNNNFFNYYQELDRGINANSDFNCFWMSNILKVQPIGDRNLN